MRILSVLALLLLLPISGAASPPERPELRLAWQPVPLDVSQPERRRLGGLTYLGGWVLRSDDRRFGGISGLHVEGDRVLALSDDGTVFRFRVGAGTGSIRALPAGPGRDAGKGNRDSESLVVAGSRAWIGFERVNEIWSYALPDLSPLGSAAPAAMRAWPRNQGAEAMVRLPDGRFLVFYEGDREPRALSEVLLFGGDPTASDAPPARLGYRPPRGYQLSDATLLPDGRLLLVNRRMPPLEGITVKLTVAALPPLRDGTVIEGREIADFRAPLTVDNFEAISATQERGRTIVWIASDDNFFFLQRNLLLKFALDR